MMKKLLLLTSVLFLVLFSTSLKAQAPLVTIDSIVISNPINCFGDLADIDVYVDNDTNTSPNPNNSSYVFYQLKAFKVGAFATFSYFSSSQTNGSSVTANGLDESTYYMLVVDSVAFNSTFNPFAQFFGNSTFLNTVLTDPSVYDFDTITIYEPTELENTTTQLSFNQCYGYCDASQEISISGGTLPYSVDGVNILGNSETLTNLCANTYSFVVSDANGCSPSFSSPSSFTINEPAILSVNGSITSNYNGQDISCFGANDGEITGSVTSGTAPFEYSLDNINWTTNQVFSGLSSGSYTLYYRDDNDCPNQETFTLNDPADLSGSLSVTQLVSCNGVSDGIIQFFVDNTLSGTPGYTYSINGGSSQNSSVFNNLSGNSSYTVFVEDVNGCTANDSLYISEPDAITFNAEVSSESLFNGFGVSCNGLSDGEITFSNISGGTTPFDFSIDNGVTYSTDSVFNALSAGAYDLQIIDDNGCLTNAASITVTESILFTANAVEGMSISCHGLSDGSVTVNINNDPTLLTTLIYSISGGGATQINNPTFTSLSGAITYGDYYISVTDANNCIAYDTIAISEPLDWIYSLDSFPEYCNSGLGSATITVDPTTGTSPYTYLWSDGQTNLTADSLVTGFYSVTVTDANLCSFSESVFIDEAYLTLTFDTVAACNNVLNASLTAQPNGTAPYTYLWSTGETTATINNLNSTTSYSITVTDANGCIIDSSITTPESAIVNLQIDYLNSELFVNCYGDPSSGIEVIASGGTGMNTYQYFIPYLYPVPQNTGVYVGLFAGTYSLHTTDGNGCTDSVNVIIYEPTELNSFTITTDSLISCYGGNNGAISVSGTSGGPNPLGGTAPYTFNWSNGSNSEYSTNLSAGSYTLIITDDNACTASEIIVLTEPSILQTSTNVLNHSYCSGDQTLASGEVEVLAGGATPNYSYLWSNGAATESTSFLLPGVYTVVVTDANGCSIQADTAEVLAGENPSIFTSSVDITCFGDNDGVIIPSATGGSVPYQFSNDGGNTYFSSGNIFSNLDEGFYFVSVVDSLGCLDIDSVYIEEPGLLDITNLDISNVSCNGANDGELTAVHIGGRPPYTYLWDDSNNQTTVTATNLSPGIYSVTVTDSSGCFTTSSTFITEPDTLQITAISSDSALCNGQADGFVHVTASGGTSSYTYNWSFGGTSANINAPAGLHTIDIFDMNGCLASSSILVDQPDPIIATYIKDSVSCVALSDGWAQVYIAGGTGDYSYLWNNGSDSSSAYNLTSGYHLLTITDENMCNKVDSVEIYEPLFSISLDSLIINDITCYSANNGAITVYASGGIGINYIRSDGFSNITQSSPVFNSIAPNQYTIYAEDFKGCIDSATILMTQPDSLYIDTTIFSHVQCFGLQNGSIQTISAIGGIGSYQYSVNGGLLYSNTGYFNNYSAGTYTVEVFDENNCVAQDIIIIDEPPVLNIDITTSLWNNYEIQCNGDSSGTADFNINGGAAPYLKTTILNGDTVITYTIDTVITYIVDTVITSTGDTLITLTGDSLITLTGDTLITLTGDTLITLTGDTLITLTGDTLITLTGDSLTTLTSDTLIISTGDTLSSYNPNVNGLISGIYDFIVEDAYGCVYLESITYSEPSAISHSFVATHVTCDGWSSGSLIDVVSGGVGNPTTYSYLWSTGDTAYSLNNLPVGSYGMTVIDENGCSNYDYFIINDNNKLAGFINPTLTSNVSCYDYCDGEIAVDVSGGIPNINPNGSLLYTYQWNDTLLQTNFNAVGLCVNNASLTTIYSCIVSDAQGCNDTIEYNLSQPAELVVTATISNPIACFGDDTGKLEASTEGGNPSYTYLWNNGVSSSVNDSLTTGTYIVVVTDNKGCVDTTEILLTEPTLLLVSVVENDESCYGYNDGEITATATGGTPEPGIPPTYYYLWDDLDAQTTQTAYSLSPDIYSVIVTDANGCIAASQTVNISGPTNALIITADSTDETCLLDDGSAQVSVLGGVPNYTFSWTGPEGFTNSNSSISGLTPGLYSINVIDENGCEVSSSTFVNGVKNIFLPGNFTTIDTTICLGKTVSFNIEEKPGLIYTWEDASTSPDRLVTPVESINNYSLTITDPNCLNPYLVEAIVRVTYIDPLINSDPSPETGNSPIIILGDQINLLSEHNNCDSYEWSTGDLYQEISVQPDKSTWYSLTVDSSGCLGNDSIYVIVGVSPYDAITPNSDGMNDVWNIVDIESYPDANIKVFNRWGEILHQCSGGNSYIAWDGTYESELLPVGTYYYIIDLNNNEKPQTGPITIIR